MNTSGGPLKKVCQAYSAMADDVIVIHDELDIDPGTIRVKHGGGLAGHNGLKSIADKLQTKDWTRIRVGIGRPPGRMPVVDCARPSQEGRVGRFRAGHAPRERGGAVLSENGLEKTQQRFN